MRKLANMKQRHNEYHENEKKHKTKSKNEDNEQTKWRTRFMYWFYNNFNNLHFISRLKIDDCPIPSLSMFLCFKRFVEM